MPVLDPDRQERRNGFNLLVGFNIYKLRQRKGISPTELADQADIDVSKLYRAENGERALSFYEASHIATALGVELEYLTKAHRSR